MGDGGTITGPYLPLSLGPRWGPAKGLRVTLGTIPTLASQGLNRMGLEAGGSFIFLVTTKGWHPHHVGRQWLSFSDSWYSPFYSRRNRNVLSHIVGAQCLTDTMITVISLLL